MNCEEIKKLVVDFIRRETKEAGFENVVIGISGGIDSALVASLAVEALGNEHVFGLMMPETFYKTDSVNYRDALELCKSLGIYYLTTPLNTIVDDIVIYDNYNPVSCDISDVERKIVRGNFLARIRMTLLYDYAARKRAIVLGTTNKTEMALGYITKWGDGGVDIEPIADLYKTEVFALSRYIKMFRNIIDKKPTAELWEGQTDEEELGISYDLADKILFWLLDMEVDPVNLIKDSTNRIETYSRDDITHVVSLMEKSQHKRELPKSLKIDHVLKTSKH